MRESIGLRRVGLLIAIGMALTLIVTTQAVFASEAKQSPSRKEEIASSQKTLLAITRAEQLPLILTADRGGTAVLLDTVTITVQNSVLGHTTTYIGATEAGVFYIDDLTDLGINVYRMWTKMNELEWWDDDDAKATPAYQCTQIGTPISATIKLDQTSGFTNTIPWDWWDEQFTGKYYTWSDNSREQVISQCVNSGITPVLVLRTRDDKGAPNYCSGNWAPTPNPTTESDLNEWWEHCFAIAYWLNVRHNYGITHFEVLNEPDYSGQGWAEYGGTTAEYVQMVQYAYDAISYANSLASLLTPTIHAPVVASYSSSYIAYSLQSADPQIQVVDYHTYADDPTTSINSVQATITNNNPDGVTEPIWVSEWGALWTTYNTITRALLTAEQLMTFSEEEVEGVTIFNMYDWSTTDGNYGVIDLQDDGQGGANRVPTETYYAYRLMTRGLKNAKDRLDFASDGLGSSGRVMVTRDTDNLYVIVKNGNGQVTVDISDVSGYSGTATVYEYSATNKDAVVATPTVTNGQFSFTAPTTGLSLAKVPAQATHAHITQITARSGPEPPWWVRLIRAITRLITHRQ